MKYGSLFRGAFFFLLNFLLPVIDAWAVSPSFDCANASRIDERAICANDQLAALDLIADEGYKYLRIHQGKSVANKLNLPFIKQRQACADNIACIKRVQIESIKLFKQNGAPVELPDLARSEAHRQATLDRPGDTSIGVQSKQDALEKSIDSQTMPGARQSPQQVAESLIKEEISQPPRSPDEVASTVASNAEKVDGSAIVQPPQGPSTTIDADPIAAPIEHEETQLPKAGDQFDPETLKAHQQKFNIGFIAALVVFGLIALALSYKIIVDRSASDNAPEVFVQKAEKIASQTNLVANKSPSISTPGNSSSSNALSEVALEKQKIEKIPQAWVWSHYKGRV